MSEWKLPWQGGCRCNQVRFEISLPPLPTMACHCTGCPASRRWRFSGFPPLCSGCPASRRRRFSGFPPLCSGCPASRRWRFSGFPPLCSGCQRMSASAFSLSVAVPASGFALKTGEPVIGGLHGNPRHFFCPHCLSWMFTRPDGLDFVNVRATLLDNSRWIEPYIDTYTSEKLPWATTPAVYKYETFPPPEVYGTLISEFAQNSPRP